MNWIMRYLSNLKNQSGLSLVEVVVMLGVTTTISLGFMKLVETQSKGVEKVRVKIEEVRVFEKIKLLLMDTENCNATLVSSPSAPVNITVGGNIADLRTKNGAILYAVNTQIEDIGKIEIESMRVENLPLADGGVPAGGGEGLVEFIIKSRRLGALVGVENDGVIERINLMVETNAGNEIINCSVNMDTNIDSVVEDSCEALGGLYDSVNNRCNFECLTGAPSDVDILSTDCLINNVVPNFYDPSYINTGTSNTLSSNMTFTGDLDVLGDIRTTDLFGISQVNIDDLIISGSAQIGGQEIATQTELFANMDETVQNNLLSALVTATSDQTGVNALSAVTRNTLSVDIPSCPPSEVITGMSYSQAVGTFHVTCGTITTTTSCPNPSDICSGFTYDSGDGVCNIVGTKTCCPSASQICNGDTYVNAAAGCNVVGTRNCGPVRVNQNFSQSRFRYAIPVSCGAQNYSPGWSTWSNDCASACTNGTFVSADPESCNSNGVIYGPGYCGSSTDCINQTRGVTCECDL